MAKRQMYVVVYRCGGTENFKWYETVNFLTEAEAQACARGVRIGGRVCFVTTAAKLAEVGLPQTFDHPEAW